MSWTRGHVPIAEKFWANVDTSGGLFACWPWTQSRDRRGGYGQLHHWPTVLKAHRVAYELTNGPIPAGLLVRHTCDNPPCCNPAHLAVGTIRDNAADMVARGRSLTGERNPNYRSHCIHGHPLRDAPLRSNGRGRRCQPCNRLARQRKRLTAKDMTRSPA